MSAAEQAGGRRRDERGGRWAIGAAVPAAAVRAAWVAVSGATAFLHFGQSPWAVLAMLLVVLGAWRPQLLFPWLFLGLIGLSMLWQAPHGWTPAVAAVLAGFHLGWTLTGLMTDVPPASRIQLRAFGRPFARFLAVQAGVQLAAYLVLAVLPRIRVAYAGPIGAAALIALAVLLVAPLLRRR